MDLKGVFSISGKPGLYQLVAQSRNGVVVEGLEDKKRFHAPATARISGLEDISVYTQAEDMPLTEVLEKVYKAAGEKAVEFTFKDDKDAAVSFFAEAVPTYDADRVYFSDIKKLLKWYNVLLAANKFEETKEEVAEESTKED